MPTGIYKIITYKGIINLTGSKNGDLIDKKRKRKDDEQVGKKALPTNRRTIFQISRMFRKSGEQEHNVMKKEASGNKNKF